MQAPDIFVFGSNTGGRHGKGAAAFARRYHSAIPGQGEGRQGNAYALPTKDDQLQRRSLDNISASIVRLAEYADQHPELRFQITRVGCGLAGYADTDILPLVLETALPDNCELPGVWLRQGQPELMRVIVAGGRDYGYDENHRQRLFDDLDRLRDKYSNADLSIVSGGARGADALGEQWAKARGVRLERYPAQWDRYGKAAGFVRNRVMAWYGTHLIAYWDGQSKGTGHMISVATGDGLAPWVRRH